MSTILGAGAPTYELSVCGILPTAAINCGEPSGSQTNNGNAREINLIKTVVDSSSQTITIDNGCYRIPNDTNIKVKINDPTHDHVHGSAIVLT